MDVLFFRDNPYERSTARGREEVTARLDLAVSVWILDDPSAGAATTHNFGDVALQIGHDELRSVLD